MKYFMIQYGNKLRSKEPVQLYKTLEEAQKLLNGSGFRITSNPWLGTVYTYLHEELQLSEDARIVMVVTPEETMYRVKDELTQEQAKRLGMELCEVIE